MRKYLIWEAFDKTQTDLFDRTSPYIYIRIASISSRSTMLKPKKIARFRERNTTERLANTADIDNSEIK